MPISPLTIRLVAKNMHFLLEDFLKRHKNQEHSKPEYNGVEYRNLAALIRANKIEGISIALVRSRIKRGLTLKLALTTPKSPFRLTGVSLEARNYKGQLYPNLRALIEANMHSSLTYHGVYSRLKSGWPLDDALAFAKGTTPPLLRFR